MPREPPVTTAVLPVRFMLSMSSHPCRIVNAPTVLTQLLAGDRSLVNLVRAIGDPHCTQMGPESGQGHVFGHPQSAVDLDGAVNNVECDVGGVNLDRCDLCPGLFVADCVLQPSRLKNQESRFLDLDAGLGDPVGDVRPVTEGTFEGNTQI